MMMCGSVVSVDISSVDGIKDPTLLVVTEDKGMGVAIRHDAF
jgi:hypothetical protein